MRYISAGIAVCVAIVLIASGALRAAASSWPNAKLRRSVPSAPQQTLLVDAGNSSCDDSTGAPAYCTIQAAVDASGAGDVIQVAAGTYAENVLIPSDSELTVAGAGASSTFVDGGDTERVFRVFSSSTVTLTNLSVTNGNFSLGGGIYVFQSDVRVERALLYDNAADAGAGFFAYQSDITIQNSAIFHNAAADDGGGIAVEGAGTLTLNNSSVFDNTATRGGGIYALDTSIDLHDSEVTDNTASSDGGGIFRNKGYLGSFDSRIQGNTATNGKGGGIATDDDTAASTFLELYNTHVLSNTADSHGGGVYVGAGPSKSITFQNSNVSYNATASDGGGIDVEEGLVIITESILHANTATDDGGAGYVFSAEKNATIQDSIISGNDAGDDGGGLFADATQTTKLDINRSFIYDNRAGGEGGALFSARTDLTQSTVYSNTAVLGGGIFVQTNLSGYNSTVSGNVAQGQGGGVYTEGYVDVNAMTIVANRADAGGGIYVLPAGSGDVQKTLIANNTATSNDGPDCSASAGDITSLGYNVVGIGNGCAGNFLDGQTGDQVGSFGAPLAPAIRSLDDNGGYTLPDGNVIPTHALNADSPAVDVIPSPTSCANDQTDQRGVPRTGQDGNDDGGADGDGCDVGAFELEAKQRVYVPVVLK